MSCGRWAKSWSSSSSISSSRRLHGLEVAVDDVVEQAVEQEADAVLGQVGAASQRSTTASMSNRSSLRTVIRACAVTKAASSLVAQLAGCRVEARAVGGQEQVGAVAVELGSLALVHRVLDGQRVQAELLAEHGEVVVVGGAQVEPDGDAVVARWSLMSATGKPSSYRDVRPVEPGAGLALGRGDLADRRRPRPFPGRGRGTS